MGTHLVSLIKLPIPGGQRRHAMLLLPFSWCQYPAMTGYVGKWQQTFNGDDDYYEEGRIERREKTREERKTGGRETKRRDNLEQRTKVSSTCPPRITSNRSLVLTKGKTEGRTEKFRKQNCGCNCEQHFKLTKSFANTTHTKFFSRVAS